MYRICYLLLFTICFSTTVYAKNISVGVSIPPQKYFIEAIAGNTVNVVVLLPAGVDPHSFEPSAKRIAELSNVDIFFTIGIGLEAQWIKRLQGVAKQIKVYPSFVEYPRAFALQPSSIESKKPHFIEGEKDVFIPLDQHVWTSPLSAIVIVERMRDILSFTYPEHASLYKKNAEILLAKIEKLDVLIRKSLADKKQRAFLSYHPVWKYFANEYKLLEIAIEEDEREPSARELADIITHAKRKSVKLVLTQPQFSAKLAYVIAGELNIPVISINPLSQNWFYTMETMRTTLMEYLR